MAASSESSSNWSCKACTTSNNRHLSYCEHCDEPINGQQYSEFNPCWDCKLCTTINNEHMPICEQCLVPKDTQADEHKLKQLKSELNSTISPKYVNAEQIRELNDDIAKQFFPICKCGTEMKAMKATVYEGISHYKYVRCDICDNKVRSDDTVYHCPKKQLADCHPDGFDICVLCRRKYNHRLRYFAALIICPSIHSKDAHVLRSMLDRLGFHQIVCLEGNEVTKTAVENKLNELLPRNNQNVNQFTVICYSGNGAWINNIYYFALNGRKQDEWISSEYIKEQCHPTTSTANDITMDTSWNKIYYRHNTLLLINSCNPNPDINNEIESQQISAALLSGTQSKQCESMLVIASTHTKHMYSYGLSVSSFIAKCSRFFDQFIDFQQNNNRENKMNVSPIMIFKYLHHCYDKNKDISVENIDENIGSLLNMVLPKKQLILKRKMSNAFGVIGRKTGASHEYLIISDPNTGEQLRTEMSNQNVKKIAKNAFKNIKILIKLLEPKDYDDGKCSKCYETYYLDAINFPNLQSVKDVIHKIAEEFDKKAYNLGTRNCQIYGSVLTARLYGIPIEYVRIK